MKIRYPESNKKKSISSFVSILFIIHNAERGELTIMGTNHQIRRKLTVDPGNDPCPPIDRT